MTQWNKEEWQYEILKRDHEESFLVLKELWAIQLLGRIPRRTIFFISGMKKSLVWWFPKEYLKLSVEELIRIKTGECWNKIYLAEKLVNKTEFPKLQRPFLILSP